MNRILSSLLARQVEKLWRERDEGIWESRGLQQHHVYSKAMCWVAFDRMKRLCGATGDQQGLAHWNSLANQVREDVLANGYNQTVRAFTQRYGSLDLDASVLRLALCGFIAADDERMISTVAAIERELMRDGFVWRYKANGSDGIEGEEGSFLACSSWLADVYVAQGRMDDARAMFDRICGAANDLGLLSEQYLPEERLALGNFPQALSHLALVNNTFALLEGGC